MFAIRGARGAIFASQKFRNACPGIERPAPTISLATTAPSSLPLLLLPLLRLPLNVRQVIYTRGFTARKILRKAATRTETGATRPSARETTRASKNEKPFFTGENLRATSTRETRLAATTRVKRARFYRATLASRYSTTYTLSQRPSKMSTFTKMDGPITVLDDKGKNSRDWVGAHWKRIGENWQKFRLVIRKC